MNAADAIQSIVACLQRGDATAAETLARQAHAAVPGHAEILRLYGIALLMLGQGDAACTHLEQALALAPESPEVQASLASALLAQGNPTRAVELLQHAVATRPTDPALQNNLGNALRAAGDDARARDAYLAAVASSPDYFNAALNLAAVELALGHIAAAEARLRKLLARQPHPQALLLLGHALARQQRYAEARDAYAEGARQVPNAAEFPYHAGLAADEEHAYAQAAKLYQRALQLDPNLSTAEGQLLFVLHREYAWAAARPLSQRIRVHALDGSGDVDPFAYLAEDATPAEQLTCARARAAVIERKQAPTRRRLAFVHAARDNHKPLRVGFVSAGFRAHPTTALTVEFFERLGQRGDIETHLYATSIDDGSTIAQRLRRAAPAFHEVVGQPATALASEIHAAAIDVLVDVDGWCAGSLPELFALRSAPIQVNWLAFPGTSGAPWMDYLIADRFLIPEAAQSFYLETVAYLPRCYQPSDTTRSVSAAPTRAACSLPEDGTVFASFNNSWKLNAASFARMCEVLHHVPGSVLWLLAASAAADTRLRQAAQVNGIDPQRLVFAAHVAPAEHLARLQLADLMLDTNPYNAHTTASDAIWAGCPVLTCPGETFAARVAGSLNHHLGLPELNARNDADFIAIATRLGNDRAVLATLRGRLAEQRQHSGLFDMQAYTDDFAMLLHTLRPRVR